MQQFEKKEIPGKVRDIKLNKYYKKFTILVIANEFGCITRSITVNSSGLGQNSQLSLDKTGFEHRSIVFYNYSRDFWAEIPACSACMHASFSTSGAILSLLDICQ